MPRLKFFLLAVMWINLAVSIFAVSRLDLSNAVTHMVMAVSLALIAKAQ
jgi:uncharacterized membrane protein YbaN (DUF454 family)